MPSTIVSGVPTPGLAFTSSVRDNFAAAKNDIEAIQDLIGSINGVSLEILDEEIATVITAVNEKASLAQVQTFYLTTAGAEGVGLAVTGLVATQVRAAMVELLGRVNGLRVETPSIPPTDGYHVNPQVDGGGNIFSSQLSNGRLSSPELDDLARRSVPGPPSEGYFVSPLTDSSGGVFSSMMSNGRLWSPELDDLARRSVPGPPSEGYWLNPEVDGSGNVIRGNRAFGGNYAMDGPLAMTSDMPPNELGLVSTGRDASGENVLTGITSDGQDYFETLKDLTQVPRTWAKVIAARQQIMRVSGFGEAQVTSGASNSFAPEAGRMPLSGNQFIRFISDAQLARNITYRSKLDGSLRSPELGTMLHILIYGQSLGVGNSAVPPLSTQNKYPNAFMFNSGVRCGLPPQFPAAVLNGATLTEFVPLFESQPTSNPSNAGETLASGMANWLSRRQHDFLGAPSNYLFSNASTNSAPYTSLAPGTDSYNNLLTMVTRGKAIADAQGLLYIVPCIVMVHGEADHANANYAANLNTLQVAVDIAIRAITGQTQVVQLLISQICSWTHTGFATSVGVLQQALAAQTYANVHQYGVKFDRAFPADGLHMDALSQIREGEYAGKAFEHIFFSANSDTQKFQPLRPLSITRTGNIVQALFNFGVANGPTAPGIIGTGEIPDTAAQVPGTKYGLEYVYNGSPVAINSAVMNADGVRVDITLAINPGAAGTELLRGGYTGVAGNNAGRTTGVRIDFHDSDPSVSFYDGVPLFNRCTHFEIAA